MDEYEYLQAFIERSRERKDDESVRSYRCLLFQKIDFRDELYVSIFILESLQFSLRFK